jgi:hypothetical protein
MATTPRAQTSPILRDLLALGVLRVSEDNTTILLPDGSAYTPSAGAVAWDDITGKPAVIAAGATQAAARTAIGAGTSSLAIGTTSVTAKAGDYAPPNAGAATRGLVLQGVAVVDATDEASAVTQLNALLAALRTSGTIAT